MDDTREALEIINAEKYDQGFSVKALAQRIARIRAEARAEALKDAAEKIYELAHDFSPGEYYSRMKIITALHKLAAILADEPKEECGEERHPLDPQNPCTDCANSVGPRPDAICDECEGDESAKPSMWRLRADVERRIEEAGW